MQIMPQVAARMASRDENTGRYQRHRPEQTLLYRIVEEYYPAFTGHLAEQGRELPDYVHREFEDYLKCGRLEHGFLRVRCESCHAEHLLAFSCKRRGFCPSCGARRMSESAALLVDEVLPEQPMRQWVLSFPFQLRFLFASQPEIMGRVLGIVYRVIATHLVKKTGYTNQAAKTGAVTLIQRFGSALNLNIHFHMLFLDGVYVERPMEQPGSAGSRRRPAPNSPNWRTSSPIGSAAFWSGKAYWSGMPKTVISPGMRSMKTRWLNCWGIRSLTVLRSGHKQAVRYSPCKRCRLAIRRINSVTRWVKWPGSACMPG